MFWLVPAAIALVAVVPVLLGVRRLGQEAAALRREMGRLATLAGPMAELRDDARRLAAAASEVARRSRPIHSTAP